MEQQENGYLRINQLVDYLNMGRSTIWAKASNPNDTFPKAIKLSERVSVWRKSEINSWVESKENKKFSLINNGE